MTKKYTPKEVSELLIQCERGEIDAETTALELSKLQFDNTIVNSAIHYLHHFYADLDLRSQDPSYDNHMREKLLLYASQLKNL